MGYLSASSRPEVQLDAAQALHNLCKLSSSRQEAAALAGIVPALCALAEGGHEGGTGELPLLHACEHCAALGAASLSMQRDAACERQPLLTANAASTL